MARSPLESPPLHTIPKWPLHCDCTLDYSFTSCLTAPARPLTFIGLWSKTFKPLNSWFKNEWTLLVWGTPSLGVFVNELVVLLCYPTKALLVNCLVLNHKTNTVAYLHERPQHIKSLFLQLLLSTKFIHKFAFCYFK